jgi:hypothetical protein
VFGVMLPRQGQGFLVVVVGLVNAFLVLVIQFLVYRLDVSLYKVT